MQRIWRGDYWNQALGEVPFADNQEYLMHYWQLCAQYLLRYLAAEQSESMQKAYQLLVEKVEPWPDLIPERSLYLCSRSALSCQAGNLFPLQQLVACLELNDFSQFALAFSSMVAWDRDFQKIVAQIQGDGDLGGGAQAGGLDQIGFPGLELCGWLFPRTLAKPGLWRQFAAEDGSRLKLLYPRLEEKATVLEGYLWPDPRLLALILEENTGLPPGIKVSEPDQPLEPLFYGEQALESLNAFLEDPGDFPLFVIYGPGGVGKKHLIRHFVHGNQLPLVFLEAGLFIQKEGNWWSELTLQIRLAVRECIWRQAPLVITGLSTFDSRSFRELLTWLKEDIQAMVGLLFLLVEGDSLPAHGSGVYELELGAYNAAQRLVLWKHYAQGYPLAPQISLERLANTFNITPGQIIGALEQGALTAAAAGRPMEEEMLSRACYGQLDHRLGEKAHRIKPAFGWDDLKLAAEEKQTLREICNRVSHRHIVLNDWNFSRLLPYGGGLSVVFAGPPGTGKTMTAQVLAHELHMELYRIDLSQLVDKFVGETEKNIRMIFDQAQKSNSILFFDEADAIFNKRMEAHSANDRFANIESSLLLQCIEEYSGISILATNHFSDIDPAFVRRFHYVMHFRLPDAALRYEIWQSMFSETAPLAGDVDLQDLAELFEFSGAYIKNVAVAAAFLAASQGEPVNNLHLLRSVKREMAKEGRTLFKEELGILKNYFTQL